MGRLVGWPGLRPKWLPKTYVNQPTSSQQSKKPREPKYEDVVTLGAKLAKLRKKRKRSLRFQAKNLKESLCLSVWD